MNQRFELFINKEIEPKEFSELMASVGWGLEEDYDYLQIKKSIASYPFVAHIRNEENELVGYISAFSDGAFSTFIGELIVKPQYQRQNLGKELINSVEEKFKGIPIYAKAFESEKGFFIQQGYTEPKRPMMVVSKKNQT